MIRKTKFLVILIIVIVSIKGMPFGSNTVHGKNSTEYWAVIVVSLSESLKPYIYDGLIQSNNWEKDHVKLLWKQEATRENILTALNWLQTSCDENDVVLFSVDSHGVNEDGLFGIWPSDGNVNGMISIAELGNEFDKINSEGLCLIFDCCFSGNFANPTENIQLQLVHKNKFEQSIQNGLDANNRVIIMGTMANGLGIHWADFDFSGNQINDISPSSIISEGFISGNDLNNDGCTSAEESYLFLREHFRKYALMGFLNIPLQIFCYLFYGFFTIPFPTISDNYVGELSLIY